MLLLNKSSALCEKGTWRRALIFSSNAHTQESFGTWLRHGVAAVI
jgi:hypothetical protein